LNPSRWITCHKLGVCSVVDTVTMRPTVAASAAIPANMSLGKHTAGEQPARLTVGAKDHDVHVDLHKRLFGLQRTGCEAKKLQAGVIRKKGNASDYYFEMPRPTTIPQSRRRGVELEHAVFAATLAELTDFGYGGLTMEGIAARARTGKAALYRRWPTKHALVSDALRHAMPPLPQLPPDHSARQNLMAIFAAHCDVLAGKTGFPHLDIVGQLIHEPELRAIFAEELIAPRLAAIEAILHSAEARGEVDAGSVTALTARVGPALIVQHFLLTGEPPSRQDLARIIDTVLAN
jgi:AcrR family transcriptional regulator